MAKVPVNKNPDQVVNHVIVKLKESTSIPIEAESISPDHFISRNAREISALPVYFGRRKLNLGDLENI
jgi:formylmethanofuran dehydrogenase subunit C